MLEDSKTLKKDSRGLLLEGVLMDVLKHPNIVRMLAWGVVQDQVRGLWDTLALGAAWHPRICEHLQSDPFLT